MTTINRRAALLGSVTLNALAPLGIAGSANLPTHAEPDPAVLASEEWRAAFDRYNAVFQRPGDLDDDDPELLATDEAERAATLKLARTVPTTLRGVQARVTFAHYIFGDIKRGHHSFALDAFEFNCWLCDDRENDLMQSLMAGLARLTGEAMA